LWSRASTPYRRVPHAPRDPSARDFSCGADGSHARVHRPKSYCRIRRAPPWWSIRDGCISERFPPHRTTLDGNARRNQLAVEVCVKRSGAHSEVSIVSGSHTVYALRSRLLFDELACAHHTFVRGERGWKLAECIVVVGGSRPFLMRALHLFCDSSTLRFGFCPDVRRVEYHRLVSVPFQTNSATNELMGCGSSTEKKPSSSHRRNKPKHTHHQAGAATASSDVERRSSNSVNPLITTGLVHVSVARDAFLAVAAADPAPLADFDADDPGDKRSASQARLASLGITGAPLPPSALRKTTGDNSSSSFDVEPRRVSFGDTNGDSHDGTVKASRRHSPPLLVVTGEPSSIHDEPSPSPFGPIPAPVSHDEAPCTVDPMMNQ
jgi:hypothetical protein